MPVGAAILGAGALSAGATYFGAQKAADTQTKMGERSIAAQREMFDIGRQGLQPFINFGTGQLGTLSNLLNPGTSASTLAELPGYKFSLEQGNRAVTNAMSNMGLGTSGPLARGIGEYTTGYAANNTFFPYLNAEMGAAGLGANAAAGVAGNATQTGQGIGASLTGIGNAQAAGTMAQAGAIGGLGTNALNSYMMYNLLNRIPGGGGTPGGDVTNPLLASAQSANWAPWGR